MNKEESKVKLRQAEDNLRMANIFLKIYKQGVKDTQEQIAELEAIINKPDRWQDSLVQPDKEGYFYLIDDLCEGLVIDWDSKTDRSPEYAFKTKEQAKLIKEKMLLVQEMHAFAHVRNEGWMPDWGNEEQVKYGIIQIRDEIKVDWFTYANSFVFGVAVKSMTIAEEMLEIFGERIESIYNKQY